MKPESRPPSRPEYPRQWVNLFEVANRADLQIPYRLLEIRGLPAGDLYDKQVNLLAKRIRFELRQPVALLRRNGVHHLAIPTTASVPRLEQQLTPHVAKLLPLDEEHVLGFNQLRGDEEKIAAAFLRHAFRAPLYADWALWGSPRARYEKRAVNANDLDASVDIYPGFVWNVIVMEDGRMFLSVDAHVRYVDRDWLLERMDGCPPGTYRGRFCLYCFGHQWYVVRFAGLTDQPISAQRFVPEGAIEPIDVYTYTQQRWHTNMPVWVRDLAPDSPAIVYQYPGSEDLRYGALALCKLTRSTADAEAGVLHQASILEPQERLRRIIEIVARHFQGARLGDRPIRLDSHPLEVERRVFHIPAQRFGHNYILRVCADDRSDPGAVPLERLGRRRLELVLDTAAGPLDTSPFYAQYLIQPHSVPRPINDGFAEKFCEAMRRVSGQGGYRAERIVYDDRGATSLAKQVHALQDAIRTTGVTRGYMLLVLPEHGKPDLHNFIKRDLWPDLQIQCVTANKLRRFYEPDGNGEYRPKPALAHKLQSFVRNCALGMMVVNRKWLWALAAPLHYDVHIGIDVLNRMAGFTFVYDRGERIIFRNARSRQQERLTAAQMREVLVASLSEDLAGREPRPRSVVIQRDGRTFPSELHGIDVAMRQLQRDGVLPPDVVIGVVDIRKTNADHLRLFEGTDLSAVANPTIGSYRVLGTSWGIVATTGWPFEFPGTAKPLTAVVIDGPLRIEWALEDIFAFSQLIFTAPDKCARLPLTVKLNDDFLEPIAGDADEETALYDPEGLEEPEEGVGA